MTSDESVSRDVQAPWWDWIVGASFIVFATVASVLWYQTAPSGYAPLWPAAGVLSGFVGSAVLGLILEVDEDA